MRRVEVTGPARLVVAWERYADLQAWPTWAPPIRGVEADGRRLAVGRSGVVRTVGGLGVRFVVTAVDEVAATWSWIVRFGPVVVTLHHDLSLDQHRTGRHRTDRHRTRAGLVLEGPGPVVRAYAPLTRLALARLVRV